MLLLSIQNNFDKILKAPFVLPPFPLPLVFLVTVAVDGVCLVLRAWGGEAICILFFLSTSR